MRASAFEQLTLVTCYPFNAIRAGGALRYVVTALPLTAVKVTHSASN